MRNIDVNRVIDNAKFTPFHWNVLFWCTLIIVFDGYDLVIYGVVLPLLMEQWDLGPLAAGLMGSAALLGMMVGAMTFGTLSDRWGRKRMILACVVLFSLTTVINGFATTPWQFGALRFIAGLGIGGVMPNVVALMTEYAPKRARSLLVAVMFSGYSVGGLMSAGLGIWIVPSFGWPVMFFLAAVPLAVLPLVVRYLPDSLGFLLKEGRDAEARRILRAIDPAGAVGDDDRLQAGGPAPAATPARGQVPALFADGRGRSTLMFWTAFFMCLLMVYALCSWLPKLMSMAGYGLSSSLMFLVVLNVGAIAGAVGGGWLADRLHPRPVLVVFFALAAASLSLLGYENPAWVLYALVAVAGATTIGSQILLYAYVAQFYPVAVRSTGLGWASGVGRNGAIVGPLLGGGLLALALPHHLNFAAFAIPGVIAAVAVFLVARRATGETAQAPEPAAA